MVHFVTLCFVEEWNVLLVESTYVDLCLGYRFTNGFEQTFRPFIRVQVILKYMELLLSHHSFSFTRKDAVKVGALWMTREVQFLGSQCLLVRPNTRVTDTGSNDTGTSVVYGGKYGDSATGYG